MKPKELYAQIRKENTEEALTTGGAWIAITDSIPRVQVDYDTVVKLAQMVREQKPDRELAIQFLSVLTGTRKTIAEILQEVNL